MAGDVKREKVQLDIQVGGNQAKKELGQLEEQARELNAQQKAIRTEKAKLNKENAEERAQIKKLEAQYRKNNKVLKENKDKQKALREQIGLTGLTVRQLNTHIKTLQYQLHNATPGTAAWKKYNAQLVKAIAHKERLQKGTTVMAQAMKRAATTVNHYAGMFMAAGFAIYKVYDTFVVGNAKLSDQLSDVEKHTNLTRNELKGLYIDLRRIDTRTTREELLKLSSVAGKLGIEGRQNILEFVKASDQIVVSLGEDLGQSADEAVKKIGKIVDVFDLDRIYGIEQAMLKAGSAVNELGQNSSANEGYIVEWVNRVQGIAKTANIAMTDVMGLASANDQLAQSAEVSSTVFTQVVPNMFKDTATYAKAAGMNVEDFTKLLKTDTNEAFIALLDGLNGNNDGLDIMTRKLDGLGLDGKRVISVLLALARDTDKIRTAQDLANQAFKDGTSITDEFNKKNDNLAGNLSKIGKALKEITTNSHFVDWLTKVTGNIATWLKLPFAEKMNNFFRSITTATTALTSYVVTVKLVTLWEKRKNIAVSTNIALTKTKIILQKAEHAGLILLAAAQALFVGNLKRATAAMRLFNTTTKLSPLGLFISLLSTAATAYFLFRNKAEEAKTEQNEFNKILEETNRLMGETKTLEERASVAKNLSKNQLETLKSDLKEQLKIEEDHHALLLQKLQKRLSEDQKLKELSEARSQQGLSKIQQVNLDSQIHARKKYLAMDLGEDNKAYQSRAQNLRSYLGKVESELSKRRRGSAPGLLSDEELKKQEELLGQAYINQQNDLKQQLLDKEMTQGDYNARMYILEQAHLLSIRELYRQNGKDLSDIQSQILDKQISYAQQLAGMSKISDSVSNSLLADEQKTFQSIDAEMDAYLEKYRNKLEQKTQAEIDATTKSFDIEKETTEARAELKEIQVGAIGEVAGALAEMVEEGSAAYYALFGIEKALAIAQVWLNYAKESAAIAVTAAEMNAVSFGVAGTIWGVAQQAKAKTRAIANTAIIASQAAATLVQKKDGGYATIYGDDDKRQYRAQVLSGASTGMLPAHPVVTPSGILASEAGAEYFVDNKSLSSQVRDAMGLRISDHVAMIEAMKNNAILTQRVTGGYSTNATASSVGKTTTTTNNYTTTDPEMKALIKKNIAAAEKMMAWEPAISVTDLSLRLKRLEEINEQTKLK